MATLRVGTHKSSARPTLGLTSDATLAPRPVGYVSKIVLRDHTRRRSTWIWGSPRLLGFVALTFLNINCLSSIFTILSCLSILLLLARLLPMVVDSNFCC